MDCQALLKQSSDFRSPSLYNATLHFISTQLFGPNYFQHLVQDSKAGDLSIEQRLHIFVPMLSCNSNAYKKIAQDDNDHLSKCAAEFLLNPWLLIQLPWNAALLNQWLMAALAEVLKVNKELIRFHWWPINIEVLTLVNVMLTRVEVLHHRLMTGIGFVGLSKNSTTAPEVSRAILKQLLLPVMPTLEMLLNKKLYATIEGLKKCSWPMDGKYVSTSNELGGAHSELAMVNDNRTAYGLNFWLTCDSSFSMFNYIQADSLEAMSYSLEMIEDECNVQYTNLVDMYEKIHKDIPAYERNRIEYTWLAHHRDIIETVREISTKEIGGDFDFNKFSFAKNMNYLFFSSIFMAYQVLLDFRKGVELNETSAILNINHLQIEAMIADIEARISGFVYTVLKREGRRVYIRTPSTIKEPVTAMRVDADYEKSIPPAWTEETLKKKFPEECRAGINSNEACPDIETLGYEEVIKIFEVKSRSCIMNNGQEYNIIDYIVINFYFS
jgi:hypothetical protein